jgi:hypothetical protein
MAVNQMKKKFFGIFSRGLCGKNGGNRLYENPSEINFDSFEHPAYNIFDA